MKVKTNKDKPTPKSRSKNLTEKRRLTIIPTKQMN